MTIKYGKFEMPEKIEKEEKGNFARFIAEPFEKGFGHTIGNALRRVMLTAIEAPAIVSVKIEGVHHEYTAIEGVLEDVINIILNLKGAKLRYLPDAEIENSRDMKEIINTIKITKEMIEESNGTYKVTLKEFLGKSDFEIINPDEHIMSVTSPIEKQIKIKVGFGRGYVTSERLESIDKKIDEILLDVSYSPVILVNYFVENTRVGKDTDFDKLILEVTTDGRITPKEAILIASQIIKDYFEIFDRLEKMEIEYEKEKEEGNKDKSKLLDKLALKIGEIELSVRSTNCLTGANIETIGELVIMPENDMLRFRNFGKKSLTEIKQKLLEMGLKLGMTDELARYGINKENIKQILKNHLEEKMEKEQ